MGPDFPLQRVRISSAGQENYPAFSDSADCETLHLKHPDYVQKTSTVLPLASSYYEEPGQCENSE